MSLRRSTAGEGPPEWPARLADVGIVRRLLAKAFAILWALAASVLAGAGLIVTGTVIGWPATFWQFVGTTVLCWLWAYLWSVVEPPRSVPVLLLGPVAALVLVAGIGLVHLLGATAILVVALLAVTHPRVWSTLCFRTRRVRHPGARATTSRRTPSPGPEDAPPSLQPIRDGAPLAVPDELTLEDLCQAWCSSYVALQRAPTVQAYLSTVEVRALYLDELERRLGTDFTRWITSVPRAAQDPRRFLRHERQEG